MSWPLPIPASLRALASATATPWASLPAAASVPGMITVVSDLNNSVWRSDGVSWKLFGGGQILYLNETQYAGTAGTGEIVVVTYPAIPLSVLAALSYYSMSLVATKTGTAQACTVGIREGSLGTISDGSAYSSSGVLTTTARVGSGGLLRKYYASLGKLGHFVAAQNTPLETATNSTTAGFPGVQSAAVSGNVYWTVTQNYSVADGTPTIEHFMIKGY